MIERMDRMDQILAAAVRQGFKVWQGRYGAWYFKRGIVTVTFARTPQSGREWVGFLNTLRGAGLEFPEGE